MASPLALDRMFGGIILSGPNDCRGSMNEARIRPHFLHSPVIEIVNGRFYCKKEEEYSLRMDEGSGLLRIGMMAVLGSRCRRRL